jgi:hypothetical protein
MAQPHCRISYEAAAELAMTKIRRGEYGVKLDGSHHWLLFVKRMIAASMMKAWKCRTFNCTNYKLSSSDIFASRHRVWIPIGLNSHYDGRLSLLLPFRSRKGQSGVKQDAQC